MSVKVSVFGKVTVHMVCTSSFKPADGGLVDLVYFGQIKDGYGTPLRNVELAVETTSRYMYEIQFDQDRPGHYRSPDIGALYKGALQKVEPSTITVTARKYGYKSVTRRVPLRAKGVLRLDFTMEPGDGASVDTTPASVDSGPMSSDTFHSPVRDFYLTNPIARASFTMAECSALRHRARLQAAE